MIPCARAVVKKISTQAVSRVRPLSYRINSTLSSLDRRLVRLYRGSGCRPLFILGAPRSGTTLIYQLVCHAYRFAYLTRYMSDLYGLHGVLYALSRPFLGQAPAVFSSSYGRVPGLFLPAESGNLWSRWLPWHAGAGHRVEAEAASGRTCANLHEHLAALQAMSGRPFAFKSVYLSLGAGFLARCLPEARFIRVVRDEFETAVSIYRGRCERKDPGAWWSVIPPNVEELIHEPLCRQVAEQVEEVNTTLQEDLRRHAPGRFLNVSYEQLCDSPRRVIEGLDEWLKAAGYETNPERNIPDHLTPPARRGLDAGVAECIRQHLGNGRGS